MPEIPCFHCGEDCGKHPVVFDDKNFCCNGCKTVYEILKDKKLYKYYQIEDAPGNKTGLPTADNKYNYLENPDIETKLLDFKDDTISKITIFIPSIHCSSCIYLLENLNTLHDGIKLSKVNFLLKRVYITFDHHKIHLSQVASLLESISYTPHFSLEDTEKKEESAYNKKIIYKLGVAGFCFGNIMLMSFPEYFVASDVDIHNIVGNFRWFNLILALPVFFYSSTEFFSSAFKNLIKKTVNIDLPVALGIIVIFLRSLYEIVSGSGPGYMDSMAGLVFFLLIGRWYQNKTYKALSFERDFKSYFPIAANMLKDGKETSLPIDNIAEGDELVIRNHELIPVDSVLIKGSGNIDYSFVTGESVPVSRKEGDMLFAGGRQEGGIVHVRALKEVSQSYLTQLWNQDNQGGRQNAVRLIEVISRYFIVAVLVIATAALAFWMVKDPSKAFDAFTAVLIIACPCALALSAPFTFGTTIRNFARAGFYLRDANIVEDLSKADTVVLDKTGTITKSNAFDVSFVGNPLSDEEKVLVTTVFRNSSHPLSMAVSDFLNSSYMDNNIGFHEYPGLGIEGRVNDHYIRAGSAAFVGVKTENRLGSVVYLSMKNTYRGYFKCENMYRSGIDPVLTALGKHYEMHLLSGDNENERGKLKAYFSDDHLKFNQKPHEKLMYIRELKNQGKVVIMIGDGLNDAGALKESDVGISLADNIYQFSPACDGILSASKFEKLVTYLLFSRAAIKVLIVSLIISFLYNVIGLVFAFSGELKPVVAAILMPISSVSVVAFATISISIIGKYKKII